jgi:hypothetical protein
MITGNESCVASARRRRRDAAAAAVPSILCPQCRALAVRTPPPHSPELDWYRCQRPGCSYMFSANMIRTAEARHE